MHTLNIRPVHKSHTLYLKLISLSYLQVLTEKLNTEGNWNWQNVGLISENEIKYFEKMRWPNEMCFFKQIAHVRICCTNSSGGLSSFALDGGLKFLKRLLKF